jgi:hypothetical protein
MFLRRSALLALSIFLLGGLAAANPPTWLRQAAAYQVPSYPKDLPGVVLHKEQQVTLQSDGKLVTRDNYAVRLLDNSGRSLAVARAFYYASTERVRDIEAWLIRANGPVKVYDKKSIIDIIADRDDVYNEGRIKLIDGSRDANTGDVFGYSVVTESTPLFYQDIWWFQTRLPSIVSRYSISLPQGWTADSRTFNHADVQPQVTGNTYTWELRNLAPIPPEPMSPSVANMAPRIAVNFQPAQGTSAVNRAFADWLDVSRWATSLHDPQTIVDANITRKTHELTAGLKTELEKIKAIGAFVQNLQYISIDIGVGHGNGYKPRSSTLVLGRGYGDCKDKANLMRAMLRVLEIEAYPIAIYSGDPSYVRSEWASPRQFNHCIIAIKVSDETEGSTIMEHPILGRLLIFDATDPYTPVGDLADDLQGSFGLLIAGNNGGLIEMPVTPPDSDLLERTIEVEIAHSGYMKGTIRERASGQSSSVFRSEVRQLSSGDYRRAIEGWLTRGATGSRLLDLSFSDRHADASFDLELAFETPRYGQLLQNRLLVFKPVIVGRRNSVYLTEPDRKNPIEMRSRLMQETVVFTLPEGFEVDEMPDPVSLETVFGTYSATMEVIDGKLHFKRTVQTNRALLPATKYQTVREFYQKIHSAEQAAVVLIRK